MAKLSSCYPLCPLIDRSPIGVTSDSAPGVAIVTLGKNIVIRYKLADQKQASSWSSKDKLSAPVLFDNSGKRYIAVFNQSLVRLWDDTDIDLNKVKKIKFDHPVHSILSSSNNAEPVVVFRNGAVISLSKSLADRKKIWTGPLSPGTAIKECFPIVLENDNCVAILATNAMDQTTLELVGVDGNGSSLFSLPVCRENRRLLGQTIMQSEGAVRFITMWDDSQMFSVTLNKTSSGCDGVGSLLYTLQAVSAKNSVAMTQISTYHLAVYGADPSEEGAMLVILNTQFMLVQAHQHFKLFSNCTNLWTLGTNILLVVGQSLAVVPFVLDTERLCALIGSHRPLQISDTKASDIEETLKMETVLWEEKENDQKENKMRHLLKNADTVNDDSSPDNVKKLIVQGYSQAMLCQKLIPTLIEEVNIPSVLWLLQNLPDFPEFALVCILKFCLDAPSSAFDELKFDVFSGTEFSTDGEDSRDGQNTLVELTPGQKFFLDVIIKTPFSEVLILPCLKSKLNLSHCLLLLQYVAQCLPQSKSSSSASALLKWAAVLLDSHYQQLLLSKDECVLSTMTALKELVESQIEYMDDLKLLHPILNRIRSGLSLQKPSIVTNKHYSVETLRLY